MLRMVRERHLLPGVQSGGAERDVNTGPLASQVTPKFKSSPDSKFFLELFWLQNLT